MNHTFFAKGAYGRTANLEDWNSGKDFQCLSTGQYFSNRDIKQMREMGYANIAFLDREARRVFTVSLSNA